MFFFANRLSNFLLLLFFYEWRIKACPYFQLDDALLPSQNPFQSSEIIFSNFNAKEFNNFGFGLWSFSQPLLEPEQYTQIQEGFINNLEIDGYLVMSIFEDSELKFCFYISFESQSFQIFHKILAISKTGNSQLLFPFAPSNYEGKWIFTFFTFKIREEQNIQLCVETTEQTNQCIESNLKFDQKLQILLGGKGFINSSLNLDQFRGLISKLYINYGFDWSESTFLDFADYCKIPTDNYYQTFTLINGLIEFDGTYINQYTINQIGNRYCLSGWIKLTLEFPLTNKMFTIIRISAFQTYQNSINDGDELFLLQVIVDDKKTSDTQILVITDMHMLPIKGPLDKYSKKLIQKISDQKGDSIFLGIQQWFFIQYEYGRTGDDNKGLFIIKFNKDSQLYQISTTDPIFSGTFINTQYFFSLGGDDFTINMIKGYLCDLKFEYNFKNDKTSLQYVCHYSCNECNGPLESNCLSCPVNSNRFYLDDQFQCVCMLGTVDSLYQTFCIPYSVIYSVQKKENLIKNEKICSFGYFEIPNSQNGIDCQECPQQNQIDILCLECLLQSKTWYLNPVCQSDFVKIRKLSDDAYQLEQRNKTFQDQYIIDEFNTLQYKPGFQSLCLDILYQQCNLMSTFHLGNQVNAVCKQNYFFKNQDCVFSTINCLLAQEEDYCLNCQTGMYSYYGKCVQCPENCLSCYFQFIIFCQICQEGHSPTNGECQKCGSYCKTCNYYDDPNINQSYLKCYSCIDNSQYFLSFDGINCLENNINNCLYAFQSMKNNIQINTLDFNFIPQFSLKELTIHCARCSSNYLYIFNNQICLKNEDQSCEFGYAEKLAESNSPYTATDGQEIYYTTQQFCLISDNFDSTVIQFNQYCSYFNQNCQTCLEGKNREQWFCVTCKQGFFSERTTGKCRTCPSALHCLECYQQQQLAEDDWKKNIRAFYKTFIENDNDHTFQQFAQSSYLYDYNFWCYKCIEGYSLSKSRCIKRCPDNCVECQIIEEENICVRCHKSQKGRMLTLYNNECIPCPINCSLCRVRSSAEIYNINPLFIINNIDLQNFDEYSHQCLKSFSDKNYYYDQKFGQYLYCTNIKGCQKQFTINLNLFCSQEEFYDIYFKLEQEEQKLFLQQNIIFQDLIGPQSFETFEKIYFYQMSNQEQVNTIVIKIISAKSQTCIVENPSKIVQIFSQSIFTAIEINLEINCLEKTIFQIKNQLTFINFFKIGLTGLTIVSIGQQFTPITFQSVFQQTLTFKNVRVSQVNSDFTKLSIILNSIKILEIEDLYIEGVNQADNNLFKITRTEFQKQVIINFVNIIDSNFQNSNLLFIEQGQNDEIFALNFKIQSQFVNSSLLGINQIDNLGQIRVEGFDIYLSKFVKCTKFLDVSYYKFSILQKINMSGLNVIDSQIILINQNSSISKITIINCQLLEKSELIINQFLQNDYYRFILEDVQISSNKYEWQSKFIQFYQYNSNYSFLNLSKIIIQGNQIINQQIKEPNYLQLNLSLIYISINIIHLSHLQIDRGRGVNEFSLSKASYLEVENMTITQDNNYILKGVNPSLYCLQNIYPDYSYTTSLFMYSITEVIINDITIKKSQSYNSPIIYYKAIDTIQEQTQEFFSLSNAFISQNLLILTQLKQKASIIMIESEQNTDIKFWNLTFIKNLQQEYTQGQQDISSLLLNLNIPLGQVIISNSKFQENLILNSSKSIIYIKSKSLHIDDCDFQSNSVFSFDIIEFYFLQAFGKNQEVYLEDIESYFPIKSDSGNGKFLSQYFYINNCNIIDSKGRNGGGFQLFPEKNASFLFDNLVLQNLRTFYFYDSEKGGAFYIDGSGALELNLRFYNIFAHDIYSREEGGLIYLLSGENKASIIIKNVSTYNIFSSLGSFIYLLFPKVSEQQFITFNNITHNSSLQGWKQFINYYINISINEQNQILNGRSLFYIEYGTKIQLTNVFLFQLFYESLVELLSQQQVLLKNLQIFNCILANKLIIIEPYIFSSSLTQIEDFKAKNLSFGQAPFLVDAICMKNIFSYSVVSQQVCNFGKSPNNQIPIRQRIQQKIYNADCLLLKIEEELIMENSGLMLFQSLSQKNSIKLTNIDILDINCKKCEKGLIFMQKDFDSFFKNYISNLSIQYSSCGLKGCTNIETITKRRILENEELLINQLNFPLEIEKYICQSNTATNGTCLNIENAKVILRDSYFIQNQADFAGGAIYINNQQNVLFINCLIENNSASFGGGISLIDSQQLNYSKLRTSLINNSATLFANDISSMPQNMKLFLGVNSIPLKSNIQETKEAVIEIVELDKQLKFFGFTTKYILIPNGQKIKEYNLFDWKNRKYIPLSLQFRLQAINLYDNQISNLYGTYCDVATRIMNYSNDAESNNFQFHSQIYFNSTTQDYNLDDEIFHFDSDQSKELFLQIQFQCNSIQYPKYNTKFPFEIEEKQKSYLLRINVRSFPCQLGEIKAEYTNSCQICDSNSGFFSLQKNQQKCKLKDDVSTIQVTPTQLRLRSGFWRPYYDSEIVSECYNLQENCLGEWVEGEASCYVGHIGALCESCDIYNTRGDGYFSQSAKFQCGTCVGKWQNVIFIIIFLIWTMVSIMISVQGTIKSVDEHVRQVNLEKMGFIRNQKQTQSAILIKILTNYFQIISTITVLHLKISANLQMVIESAGSPIQPIIYSLDCFLTSMFNFQILYSKMVWAMIMPVIFINLYFIIYVNAIKFQLLTFNKSAIATAMIYLYIYFQPNLVGGLIALLSYREISGYKWIAANVAYTYNTQVHVKWILQFCLPSVIILALLIPLYFYISLSRNKQNLQNKTIKSFWGYLYNEYKTHAYFWEILKIVKRELIIIALTFYDDFVIIKGTIILFILFIYLDFNRRFHPYNNKKMNTLDYYSAFVSWISILMGIGIYISIENDRVESKIGFTIILIISNIYFLLMIITAIFQEYFEEANVKHVQKLDEIRTRIKAIFPCLKKISIFDKLLQNQHEKKQKIKENFKKLKEFVLPQVKQILEIKKQAAVQQKQKTLYQFISHRSIESLTMREGSGLIQTPVKLSPFSKYSRNIQFQEILRAKTKTITFKGEENNIEKDNLQDEVEVKSNILE